VGVGARGEGEEEGEEMAWGIVTVLYPPPWLPPDSTRLQWNVGIPFGIRWNGRNVAFLWIPPDSTGF